MTIAVAIDYLGHFVKKIPLSIFRAIFKQNAPKNIKGHFTSASENTIFRGILFEVPLNI